MTTILCPKCQRKPAPIHPQYGVMWCDDCNKAKQPWTGKYPEFTTDEIKEDRIKYFKSALQPFREGQLSREYVEAYGTKGIKVSPEEVKKSKYTWQDLKGWRTRDKSY